MDAGIDAQQRVELLEVLEQSCRVSYNKNPFDADNLTKWGRALIELSQLHESQQMLLEATSKLEEALEINPKKHDAWWLLGNAYISVALVIPDFDVAKPYFQKAVLCFQQAVDEDPRNELYRKSLEISRQAPELHAVHHRNEPRFMGGPSSSSSAEASMKKKQISDFTYDVMGWICLAVGVVAYLGFTKNHMAM